MTTEFKYEFPDDQVVELPEITNADIEAAQELISSNFSKESTRSLKSVRSLKSSRSARSLKSTRSSRSLESTPLLDSARSLKSTRSLSSSEGGLANFLRMFKTKNDPESIKKILQGAPVLVSYHEYVKYISAVYNYCNSNRETYSEAFDRAINNKIDYLILQKALARTDNQIQNDMVFEILVTISTLNSLGADFTEIKDKLLEENTTGVKNYLGIINSDLTSLDPHLRSVESLSFFIPRNLNKNFTAIDHKKILNAERMNKTNYNSFPWPYFLLELLIFLFKQSRKVFFKNKSNETMLVRYIDLWIVKLTKLLLSRKKAKCMRITALLTGKKTDLLGNDYNLKKTSMDEIETTDCDKFSVIRRIRCKRLVDARKKLNSSFDSNCNIKVETRRLGGKKKARRRTKKMDGGNNGAYFALCFAVLITGIVLMGIGHTSSSTLNPAHPLALAGLILFLIGVAAFFNL